MCVQFFCTYNYFTFKINDITNIIISFFDRMYSFVVLKTKETNKFVSETNKIFLIRYRLLLLLLLIF